MLLLVYLYHIIIIDYGNGFICSGYGSVKRCGIWFDKKSFKYRVFLYEHFVEFGGGLCISFDYNRYYLTEEMDITYFPTLSAGYRYQKKGSTVYYRIAANMLYGEPDGIIYMPMMTVTIGVSLRPK